ncbi:MAG TPA: SGNH/GDSL hydrolase family protein [Candidatus Limnocylindrales bacterium]|nr:SGNH/GDSL hydrolase family protein [Candidatus Limnocylindrales bacterium]
MSADAAGSTEEPGSASQQDRVAAAPSRKKRLVMGWLSVGISLLFTALLMEVGLRIYFPSELSVVQDERNLLYRYDPILGWFPVAGRSNLFLGTRTISVAHNSQGFRAATDYAPADKPGIIFLGDSFVWGYDVELSERFTEKLQTKHPEWSIYNFGVSGYGTDQEYLLLHQQFDRYHPRVVFLMYEETDDGDNSTNHRWGYYKPYATVTGSRLKVHGIPVPRSDRFFFATHKLLVRSYVIRLLALGYFKLTAPRVIQNTPNPSGALVRDIQRYVSSKDARLVVGLTWRNPPMEQILTYFKIPFVDLSTDLRYSGKGYHWSAEGHSFVADKIDEFLAKGRFMGE